MKRNSRSRPSFMGKAGISVLIVVLTVYQYILFLARDTVGTLPYLFFVALGLIVLSVLIKAWLHFSVNDKPKSTT